MIQQQMLAAKSAIKMCKLALNATGHNTSPNPSHLLTSHFSYFTPNVIRSWFVACQMSTLSLICQLLLLLLLQMLQLLVDLHSYISWQIAISTLISAVLRFRPGQATPHIRHPTSDIPCPLILSTVAAYNFVYNYIEIKSKTQAATATATATATCHTNSSCICWQIQEKVSTCRRHLPN